MHVHCRNGVVKYECVMRLREQLDQLGQMKGITQDEKGEEQGTSRGGYYVHRNYWTLSSTVLGVLLV